MEKRRDELEKEINHWRKQAPDGFFKRIVVGGFSMRDIQSRISKLIEQQGDIDADIHRLAEQLSRGGSFIKDELDKVKLQSDHLQRQINLCDVEISMALGILNDSKSVLEIFQLFQADSSI